MPIKSIIGFIISLGLVLLVVCYVDWPSVWKVIADIDLRLLLPVVIAFFAQHLLRAIRWKFLLPAGSIASTRQLFDSLMVGNMANFVLPMRAGEFIRPFLLTRYTKLHFPACLVSVIVERFFDLALVLLLFSGITLIIPGMPALAIWGASALSSLALGIFCIMVLGSFMENTILKIFDVMLRPLPSKIRQPLRKFSQDFLKGAAVLKAPSRVFIVIGLTVGVWALIALLTWFFIAMFHIEPTVVAAIGITVITALAVAAPSAPGSIGVYHAACLAAFTLFSYSLEKAAAFAIITHLFNFFGFILYGCYVLWRDGLKLAHLKPGANKA